MSQRGWYLFAATVFTSAAAVHLFCVAYPPNTWRLLSQHRRIYP